MEIDNFLHYDGYFGRLNLQLRKTLNRSNQDSEFCLFRCKDKYDEFRFAVYWKCTEFDKRKEFYYNKMTKFYKDFFRISSNIYAGLISEDEAEFIVFNITDTWSISYYNFNPKTELVVISDDEKYWYKVDKPKKMCSEIHIEGLNNDIEITKLLPMGELYDSIESTATSGFNKGSVITFSIFKEDTRLVLMDSETAKLSYFYPGDCEVVDHNYHSNGGWSEELELDEDNFDDDLSYEDMLRGELKTRFNKLVDNITDDEVQEILSTIS